MHVRMQLVAEGIKVRLRKVWYDCLPTLMQDRTVVISDTLFYAPSDEYDAARYCC